jgi:hypothetical protein
MNLLKRILLFPYRFLRGLIAMLRQDKYFVAKTPRQIAEVQKKMSDPTKTRAVVVTCDGEWLQVVADSRQILDEYLKETKGVELFYRDAGGGPVTDPQCEKNSGSFTRIDIGSRYPSPTKPMKVLLHNKRSA